MFTIDCCKQWGWMFICIVLFCLSLQTCQPSASTHSIIGNGWMRMSEIIGPFFNRKSQSHSLFYIYRNTSHSSNCPRSHLLVRTSMFPSELIAFQSSLFPVSLPIVKWICLFSLLVAINCFQICWIMATIKKLCRNLRKYWENIQTLLMQR